MLSTSTWGFSSLLLLLKMEIRVSSRNVCKGGGQKLTCKIFAGVVFVP